MPVRSSWTLQRHAVVVLKPTARDLLLLAGTIRSRRWSTAAAEQSGNHAEGLLPGFTSNSPSRPLPVIGVSRKTSCQRPVSDHCRHCPTAVRSGAFSRAVAQGLAALVGIGSSPYVRRSSDRTGTADPLQSFSFALWAAAMQRVPPLDPDNPPHVARSIPVIAA